MELARQGSTVDITAFPVEQGEDAYSAAEALERYLASGAPTDRVTISGRVATVYPPATATPDDLLFAADKALYRAKCLGRNRIVTSEVQWNEAAAQSA